MSIKICSLASGSSGNCYVIKTENTTLLVDAGISAKQIKERLLYIGSSIKDVSAILITHEHSDHIKGLGVLKKENITIYASAGTAKEIKKIYENIDIKCIKAGSEFSVGDIEIASFLLFHDAAEPVGYTLINNEKKICIVTDTGIITGGIRRQLSDSDIVVLESNHDVNILKMGPYPWFLKQRILGERGHLSNETAAKEIGEIISIEQSAGAVRKRKILLAHLSKENNFPEMAVMTFKSIFAECGIKEDSYELYVLSRNEVSEIYV